MASETYFQNFKLLQYGNSASNNIVVDITQRIATLKNVEKNPYVFYPLEITSGTRADQLAQLNYNDSYSSWVFYLTNDITDPYYEWYLTPDEFNQFITTKYGSVANAMSTIAFWRNAWHDRPTLSPSEYNVEIAGNPQRIGYWQANVGSNGKLINYFRKPEDWTATTNQVIDLTYSTLSSNLIVGETVTINAASGTATGVVVQYSNTDIVLQHIISYNGAITTGTITGQQSGATGAYTAISYLANNITSDVAAYWEPVYYYDYENEKNNGNRSIRFMQPQYVPSYIKNVKDLLSQ